MTSVSLANARVSPVRGAIEVPAAHSMVSAIDA